MERKIRKIKEEIKGITLVALVVTIIVLLILSGVAISLSIGEDGIFKRTGEGAETYKNASENEKSKRENGFRSSCSTKRKN